MSAPLDRTPESAMELIANSRISIYDELATNDPRFLSIEELEHLLTKNLLGLSLDYPIRTRAKVAKTAVCQALGYKVPSGFKKTQPRFPGQQMDVYVQKANNLQIWNEEVSPQRRYGLIKVNDGGQVVAIRVLTGEAIAGFDRTGTLTSKFQAARIDGSASSLVSPIDTAHFCESYSPLDTLDGPILSKQSPIEAPANGRVLSIAGIWNRLSSLVGKEVTDPGLDQERNRGAELHRVVCEVLGLGDYRDGGQFPDVRSQAIEVKLQTSPTVDLGLVSPDSEELVAGFHDGLLHCDIRYAVFYGDKPNKESVRLTALVLVTGEAFFTEFRKFGGLVQNKKLQIPLPESVFGKTE